MICSINCSYHIVCYILSTFYLVIASSYLLTTFIQLPFPVSSPPANTNFIFPGVFFSSSDFKYKGDHTVSVFFCMTYFI